MKMMHAASQRLRLVWIWFVSPPWPDQNQNRRELLSVVLLTILVAIWAIAIFRGWLSVNREFWRQIVAIFPALPFLIALYALWRQWRPVVIVAPIIENSCLYLQVKNFGGGLARDVKVYFWNRNDMYNAAGDRIISIGAEHGIPALPPNERHMKLLGRAEDYFNIDYVLGSAHRTEAIDAIVHTKGIIFPWHIFSEKQRVDMRLVTNLPYRAALEDLLQHERRFERDRKLFSAGWSESEIQWARTSLQFVQTAMAGVEAWPADREFCEPGAIMDAIRYFGYTIMPPTNSNGRDDVCVAVNFRGADSPVVVAARRVVEVPPWLILLRRVIELQQQSGDFPQRMARSLKAVEAEEGSVSYINEPVETDPNPHRPQDV